MRISGPPARVVVERTSSPARQARHARRVTRGPCLSGHRRRCRGAGAARACGADAAATLAGRAPGRRHLVRLRRRWRGTPCGARRRRASGAFAAEREHAQQRHAEAGELVGGEREVAPAQQRDLVDDLDRPGSMRAPAPRRARGPRRRPAASGAACASAIAEQSARAPRARHRTRCCARRSLGSAIAAPWPSPSAMRSSSGQTRSPPTEPSMFAHPARRRRCRRRARSPGRAGSGCRAGCPRRPCASCAAPASSNGIGSASSTRFRCAGDQRAAAAASG